MGSCSSWDMPTKKKATSRGNNGAGNKFAGHNRNNSKLQHEDTERERLRQAAVEKEESDSVREALMEPLSWMEKTIDYVIEHLVDEPLDQ